MVAVVQLVERQIVILVVVGSSPIGHPIFLFPQSNKTVIKLRVTHNFKQSL